MQKILKSRVGMAQYACLIIIAALFTPSYISASPQLFDKESVDLGKMKEGEAREFTIEFTNVSDKHVNVLSVDTSCGCTEAKAIKTSIAPGETGSIQVNMDTSGKSGRFLKVLEITTDTADAPYELTLTGDVVHSDIASEPGTLFRGKCAACHMTDNIEVKSGQELYDSLCYICHKDEIPGRGNSLPASIIRETISNGRTGTSMPAFSTNFKGPLGLRQIDSLVLFISAPGRVQ